MSRVDTSSQVIKAGGGDAAAAGVTATALLANAQESPVMSTSPLPARGSFLGWPMRL